MKSYNVMTGLELIKAAKDVPIAGIVGQYVDLKRMGSGVYCGPCPFHSDTHADSFKIYVQSNRFRCFVCGASGDVVDFVCQMEHVGPVEAAKKILGLVEIKPEIMDLKTKKVKRYSKADPVAINTAYGAFVAAAPPLTEEHIEKIKEWGLAEYANQDKEEFFEWPSPSLDFWRRFQNILVKNGIKGDRKLRDIVYRVPGFYWDRNNERLGFTSYGGIGIIQRDMYGNISGLQCRIDHPKDGSKYKLMSSSYADSDDDAEPCINGASIGTIPDYCLTDEPRRYVITEGRKKALVLRRDKGCSVFSINGVGALDPAAGFITYAKEEGADVIDICLDADAGTNKAVAGAAYKLADMITAQGMTPRFLVWDGRYGKGIDDYLNCADPAKGPLKEVSLARYRTIVA